MFRCTKNKPSYHGIPLWYLRVVRLVGKIHNQARKGRHTIEHIVPRTSIAQAQTRRSRITCWHLCLACTSWNMCITATIFGLLAVLLYHQLCVYDQIVAAASVDPDWWMSCAGMTLWVERDTLICHAKWRSCCFRDTMHIPLMQYPIKIYEKLCLVDPPVWVFCSKNSDLSSFLFDNLGRYSCVSPSHSYVPADIWVQVYGVCMGRDLDPRNLMINKHKKANSTQVAEWPEVYVWINQSLSWENRVRKISWVKCTTNRPC